MTQGLLESIDSSLRTIVAHISTLGAAVQDAAATDDTTETPPPGKKATSKKVASKKVASKKVASKKGKALDLDDITVFKKELFRIAEASGVDDVMPKLKAFIKANGYASSDEIEPEDRAGFLADVTSHFADDDDDDDDNDDDYNDI